MSTRYRLSQEGVELMQIDECANFLNNKVGIYKIEDAAYPLNAPLFPPERYPKYFDNINISLLKEMLYRSKKVEK